MIKQLLVVVMILILSSCAQNKLRIDSKSSHHDLSEAQLSGLQKAQLLCAQSKAVVGIETLLQMDEALRKNPSYWASFGRCYQNDQKPYMAKYNYDKALSLNPNHIEALVGLSMLMIDLEQYHEALIYLQKIVRVDKHNPYALLMLAAIRTHFSDYDKSNEYLGHIEKNYLDKNQSFRQEVQFLKAKNYLFLKKFSESQKVFESMENKGYLNSRFVGYYAYLLHLQGHSQQALGSLNLQRRPASIKDLQQRDIDDKFIEKLKVYFTSQSGRKGEKS